MKGKVTVLLIAMLSVVYSFGQEKAKTNVLVTDFEENPISGAQVEFFDTKNDAIITGVSNSSGEFIVELPAGLYNIRLKSVGKSKDYSAIEIPKLGEREVYNNVNIHIQYEEERSFTLSDLHFETGKSNILKNSYGVLDDLVQYLELKEGLVIEVGGHTDNEGSDESNMVLSQDRAEAVKKYLVNKGINSKRIVAKGYGESQPIAENETANGRALNRRTEINILE